MSIKGIIKTNLIQPNSYQLRVKGQLDSQWADWFEGFEITWENNGDTLLTGQVVDQSALYGLLKKVRDLGMPLVSINQVSHENQTFLNNNLIDASDTKKTRLNQSNIGETKMTTTSVTSDKRGTKISVKIKLSALWITLMLVYIYADIFHLFMPGKITSIMDGQMGPFAVTQLSLFSATILMMIPALMVFLSLSLKSKVNRLVNILLGSLYTFVNISNAIGETWVFYISFVIVEIGLTCLIVVHAIRWRNQEE